VNSHTSCGACPAAQGTEVPDQGASSFDGGGVPWGNAPIGQVFTADVTGYLTHFGYAGYPCYAAWNEPCGFTLELRAIDGNGNPGERLWSGRGQEPPQQTDPNSVIAWSTTALENPPFVAAGTQYAILITPDWWEEFFTGTGNPGHAVQWDTTYHDWTPFSAGVDLLFQTWVTPGMVCSG
jgi:hypothetical protein